MNFVAKCCQPPRILGDFAVDRWKFIDFTRLGILRPSLCTDKKWNSPFVDRKITVFNELLENEISHSFNNVDLIETIPRELKLFNLKDELHLNKKHGCKALAGLFLNHCMPNLDLKHVRLVAGTILRIRLVAKM